MQQHLLKVICAWVDEQMRVEVVHMITERYQTIVKNWLRILYIETVQFDLLKTSPGYLASQVPWQIRTFFEDGPAVDRR